MSLFLALCERGGSGPGGLAMRGENVMGSWDRPLSNFLKFEK